MPRHRLLSTLFIALLLLAIAACSAGRPAAPAAERLGITLIGIYQTAGGYMLDFRYRIDDPQKALPLFDHAIIPYLVHDASGAKFAVPSPAKTGPLRQMPRQGEAGRHYFIFFANPGQYIKAGDHVTVVHGDDRFEHLEVQ